MKRRYLVALLLAAAVIGGLVLARSDDEPPIIAGLREVHRQMDPSVPAGAVLFLGDSITMALATAAVAPRPVNYGIGYQRSDQLIESLEIYDSMERASVVVVTIGTNDLLQGRADGIEDRYRTILERIPVPVVLNSPPPSTRYDARPVALIAKRVCAQFPDCTFVDAFAMLDDKPNVLLRDGVHLSPEGYRLWIPALRKALTESQASS